MALYTEWPRGVKHRQNFTFSSLLHPPLSNQIVLLFSPPFLTSFLSANVNSGIFRNKRDFYHYRYRSLVTRSLIPNSDCSLQIPEHLITANVFTGMRASKSLWSVRKLIFVTFGSKFAGVRRLSKHHMLRYEYLMLPIQSRIYSVRLSFPLSVAHWAIET